jgi:hypothetical protein
MNKLYSHVTFDHTNHPPLICHSDFYQGEHGELIHYLDDKCRAIVPPEGWEQYAKDWPEAQKAIDQLTTRAEFKEAFDTMVAASNASLADNSQIITPAGEQPATTDEVVQTEQPVTEQNPT